MKHRTALLVDVVTEWVGALDDGLVFEILPGSAAHLKARQALQQYNNNEKPISNLRSTPSSTEDQGTRISIKDSIKEEALPR